MNKWTFSINGDTKSPLLALREFVPEASIDIEFNEKLEVFITVQLFEDIYTSNSLYECMSFLVKLIGEIEMRKRGLLIFKSINKG